MLSLKMFFYEYKNSTSKQVMLDLDLSALTVCAGKRSHLELAVALKGFWKKVITAIWPGIHPHRSFIGWAANLPANPRLTPFFRVDLMGLAGVLLGDIRWGGKKWQQLHWPDQSLSAWQQRAPYLFFSSPAADRETPLSAKQNRSKYTQNKLMWTLVTTKMIHDCF